MIKYDNLIIAKSDYKTCISGKEFDYEFFETSYYSAVKHLSGENIICVAYYVTDPIKPIRNYSHISFHKNLKDFFETDKNQWSGIHNMLFKSVNNEKEAHEIIRDIKSKHSFT